MSGAVPSKKLETMIQLQQKKHFVWRWGNDPQYVKKILKRISDTKLSIPEHSHLKFEFPILNLLSTGYTDVRE